VRNGRTWYHDLRKTYGFARDCTAFQTAVARLQARRGADLEVAAPAIIDEVSEQTTAKGLYDLIDSYLGVPGDDKTAPGARIAQAVAERKKVIPPEEPTSAELTNEQKIWATIGAIFAGAIVLDALAGPGNPSTNVDLPREHWKCGYCGGRGLVDGGDRGSPLFGNMMVCPVCGGSGEGW